MTLPSEDIHSIATSLAVSLPPGVSVALLAISRKAMLMERELARFQAEAAARQPADAPWPEAMATIKRALAGDAQPTQAMRDLMGRKKPPAPRDFA